MYKEDYVRELMVPQLIKKVGMRCGNIHTDINVITHILLILHMLNRFLRILIYLICFELTIFFVKMKN